MDELDVFVSYIQERMLGEARGDYSARVIEYFEHPRNVGSIPETPYYAHVTGACGDTMQIYLEIADNIIFRALFNTDGCISTIACGCAITEKLRGLPVTQALELSPARLLQELDGLPVHEHHCAVLTIRTLFTALGKYLTRPDGGGKT